MEHRISFYNGNTLLDYANIYYDHIPNNIKILACATSSGITIASALAIIGASKGHNLKIAYLRKSEDSFRKNIIDSTFIVGACVINNKPIYIVDDLIDTGRTVKAIINAIRKEKNDDEWQPDGILVWEVLDNAFDIDTYAPITQLSHHEIDPDIKYCIEERRG